MRPFSFLVATTALTPLVWAQEHAAPRSNHPTPLTVSDPPGFTVPTDKHEAPRANIDRGTPAVFDVLLDDEVARPGAKFVESGTVRDTVDLHANTAQNPFFLGFAAGSYAPSEGERIDPQLASTAMLAGKAFEPLTGTAAEVRAIADVFDACFHDAPRADVLLAHDASKPELLERAHKARFIHVATHGFFAPKSMRSVEEEAADRDDIARQGAAAFEQQVRGFAPMTLCGLALAGANVAADETDATEGVATAEELRALDLSRCELAVLSACDTSAGESRAGQGIASFQKALHAAGARTVVTSLWKVPDAATRELMLAFYRGIWIDKLSKSEALWRAKMMLRERRAPLRDWAGWVLSGNPD